MYKIKFVNGMEEFENLFSNESLNDLFKSFGMEYTECKPKKAPTNIVDYEDRVEVFTIYPNAKKELFNIFIDSDDILNIKYESDKKGLKDENKYGLKEFALDFDGFERRFRLPKFVDVNSEIKAKYENGILTLTIKKNVPEYKKVVVD